MRMMDDQALQIIAEAQRYTATRWGHSRYAEWHRCETAHHLRYHKKLKPIENDLALDIGSAVHIGMAAGMLGYKYERTDLEELALFAIESEPRLQEEAKLDGARLLRHYIAFWGETAWNFGGEVVAAEKYLEADVAAEVGKPGMFPPTSTRVDFIVRVPWERGGQPIPTWMWGDHKTRRSSCPGVKDPGTRAEFIRGLHTDDQFLRHSYCLWKLTGRLRPGVLNFFVKTKEPKFERIYIQHTEKQLRRWGANEGLRVRRYSGDMDLPTDKPLMEYGECEPAMGKRCWAFNWCHGTQQMRDEQFEMRGAT